MSCRGGIGGCALALQITSAAQPKSRSSRSTRLLPTAMRTAAAPAAASALTARRSQTAAGGAVRCAAAPRGGAYGARVGRLRVSAVFERFTERAIKAVMLAQQEAKAQGRSEVIALTPPQPEPPSCNSQRVFGPYSSPFPTTKRVVPYDDDTASRSSFIGG